jgi:hypothetical protein
MRAFLGGEKEVPIVVADVHPASILIDPTRIDGLEFKPPSHASFVGMQECIALASLQKKLELVFPRKTFPFTKATMFDPSDSAIFFSVGGFIANQITRSVLKEKSAIDGITLDMEKVIIHDTIASAAHCETEIPDSDNGFIVITRNPFRAGGRCCLLFGCWAQGSRAAIDYLMKPVDPSSDGQQFLGLGKRSNLFATVKTKLHGRGIIQTQPELTYVRPAAN